MQKRTSLMAVVFALVVLLVGTSNVLAQAITCTECHNDTTVITGKKTAWSKSMHGTGTAYGRGTSAGCAGCHSGGGFSSMVAAGLTPDTVEAGDSNPTRQDCRACHQIHTSYTATDWALETTDPVALFAFDDVTYDGGKGNLCANCHQPRKTITAADPNGNIEVDSTHWGPHHGPQSTMLLGLAGAGDVVGRPSAHAMLVRDTCVTCHVGKNNNHTFEPVESACVVCHSGAEDFDIDGVQTEVKALIVQVRDLLVVKGLLAVEKDYEIGDDGVIEEVVVGYEPVVGVYPAAQASALWNYIFIAIEDGSLGVHNPGYTKALLEAAVAALQ